MKRIAQYFLLLPLLPFFLTQCAPGNGDADFQTEKNALMLSYDSLMDMTMARIENLEAAGEGTTAIDENAIQQEVAKLQQLRSQLATEKDNLQVASSQNWGRFRDSLQHNIINIRETYFPGPE